MNRIFSLFLIVASCIGTRVFAAGATLWACQNTCYHYSSADQVSFNPSDFPLYGAKPENIVEGEQITFCAENPSDIQRAASDECARRHPNASGDKVDALVTLFPAEVAVLCNSFGQPCNGIGVKRAEYACAVNCASNANTASWYPTRISYCADSNREALDEGTKFFNEAGNVCTKDYSIVSPETYDYISVPLLDRCESTGKECS